jgi:hypothetical protein
VGCASESAADGTAGKIREAALLTQAEVAEQIGVTPAAAAWEAGGASRLASQPANTGNCCAASPRSDP